MTEKKNNDNEISNNREKQLTISQNDVIDLTELNDDQIIELKKQYAEGMIDINKKAAELQVDVRTLEQTLKSFVDQTSKATESGSSTTITHTQTSNIGRTEVVIGNTDRAASGKLSRSATGEKDKLIWILAILAVVAVAAVIVLGGNQ